MTPAPAGVAPIASPPRSSTAPFVFAAVALIAILSFFYLMFSTLNRPVTPPSTGFPYTPIAATTAPASDPSPRAPATTLATLIRTRLEPAGIRINQLQVSLDPDLQPTVSIDRMTNRGNDLLGQLVGSYTPATGFTFTGQGGLSGIQFSFPSNAASVPESPDRDLRARLADALNAHHIQADLFVTNLDPASHALQISAHTLSRIVPDPDDGRSGRRGGFGGGGQSPPPATRVALTGTLSAQYTPNGLYHVTGTGDLADLAFDFTPGAPAASPANALDVTTAHPTKGDLEVTLPASGAIQIPSPEVNTPATTPAIVVTFALKPEDVALIQKSGDLDDLTLTVYSPEFDFSRPLATSSHVSIATTGFNDRQMLDCFAAVTPTAATRLFNNQPVTVIVHVQTHHDVLRVPSAAFQHGADSANVFIVGPDNIARARPITRGPTDYPAGLVEITAGLSPTDTLILNPPGSLSSGDPVNPTPQPAPLLAAVEHPVRQTINRVEVLPSTLLVSSPNDHPSYSVSFAASQNVALELMRRRTGEEHTNNVIDIPVLVTEKTNGTHLGAGHSVILSGVLDPSTQTMTCTAPITLDSNTLVLPNQTVTVTFTLQTVKDALTIPTTAIRGEGNGSFFVYVVGPDNIARKRPITHGIINGNHAEITAGLSESDTLLSEPPSVRTPASFPIQPSAAP